MVYGATLHEKRIRSSSARARAEVALPLARFLSFFPLARGILRPPSLPSSLPRPLHGGILGSSRGECTSATTVNYDVWNDDAGNEASRSAIPFLIVCFSLALSLCLSAKRNRALNNCEMIHSMRERIVSMEMCTFRPLGRYAESFT